MAHLEEIEKLYKLGIAIIPMSLGEKSPLVAYSQYKEEKTRPTWEEIVHWRGRFNCDWAILCGKSSNKVYVLDFEDPALYENYFSQYKKLVARTPSGGVHLYIKSKKPVRIIHGVKGYAMDLQGDGALAVIPSGNADREWLNITLDTNGVPEIDEVDNLTEITLGSLPNIESEYILPGSMMEYAHEHYPVIREGHNYYQTWCPFHDDKEGGTPSLTFYEQGNFICFSCAERTGAKGKYYQLVKMTEHLTDEEMKARYKDISSSQITPSDVAEEVYTTIEKDMEMIHDVNNFTYVVDNRPGMPVRLIPIKSDQMVGLVQDISIKKSGHLLSTNQVNLVINSLKGKASFLERQILPYRIGAAMIDGIKGVVYDLRDGTFATITPSHIDRRSTSPIYFLDDGMMDKQVFPETFDINDVWKVFESINVKFPEDKIRILTWLVSCFIPEMPHPILILTGSPGSGKSYMARFIKRLIDPVKSAGGELTIWDGNQIFQLSHGKLVVFDNISDIGKKEANLLCMVVTGGSVKTRTLFTTNDSSQIDINSYVILTTINDQIVEAGDLADRTQVVTLQRFKKFMSEAAINQKFEANKPLVLGGLLMLSAMAMEELQTVDFTKLDSKNRLASFVLLGDIISKFLNVDTKFSEVMDTNDLEINQTVAETDPMTEFFLYTARYSKDHLEEKMQWQNWFKLFQEWVKDSGYQAYSRDMWPQNPRALSARYNGMELTLEKVYGLNLVAKVIGGKKYLTFVQEEPQKKIEEVVNDS